MAKYTGVSQKYLNSQAAERERLRQRHAKQRREAKSYGKRGAAAAAARRRMQDRQAREMADLMARQAAEREQARSQYRLRQAKANTWNDLRNQYALGNVAMQDFRPENLRYALLNYNGLTGQDRALFEKTVRNMTQEDLRNLANMYKNVLEVWKDSEGYFEAISEEVVKKIRGMARQTAANISRMLRKGESDLDEGTVAMALAGWNFRLKTTEQTREGLKVMGYE